eukprot:1023759-Prorocentrum_minimum.AAC.2
MKDHGKQAAAAEKEEAKAAEEEGTLEGRKKYVYCTTYCTYDATYYTTILRSIRRITRSVSYYVFVLANLAYYGGGWVGGLVTGEGGARERGDQAAGAERCGAVRAADEGAAAGQGERGHPRDLRPAGGPGRRGQGVRRGGVHRVRRAGLRGGGQHRHRAGVRQAAARAGAATEKNSHNKRRFRRRLNRDRLLRRLAQAQVLKERRKQ